MRNIKFHFIIFLLLFLYSCSSNSFYQRQHLSGRYADKIQKPAKIHSDNISELIIVEYPSYSEAVVIDKSINQIKFNSTPNAEKSLNIPKSSTPKLEEFDKINVLVDDSLVSQKKRSYNYLKYKPKKAFKTALPYLGISIASLVVAFGIFISGSIIFLSAIFGGLEILAILLIPGSIILSLVFYWLLLLFTKGFENYKIFNSLNKVIYVISSVILMPCSFLIAIGLSAYLLGVIFFLIRGIVYLIGIF